MSGHRLTGASLLLSCVALAAVFGVGGVQAGSSASASTAAPNVPFAGSVEVGTTVGYPQPKPGPLKIGMSTALGANEYLRAVETAARLETKKLGGTFVALDAQAKVDKQVSDIQQLIAQGVDAIIITPLDVNALRPIAKQAKAAGIPIFGQDLDLQHKTLPAGFTGQVWQRRDYLSYLQAREAAKRLPAGSGFGQIGFVVKVPTIETALSRAAFWAKKFGLKPLGRSDNPSDDIAGGEKAMTQLMGTAPEMKGVIGYNDESVTGAASAARAAGKKLVLIGVNGGSLAYSSVRSGRIAASVQINAPDMGRFLVWGAYGAKAGKKLPVTVMTHPPAVIDSSTVGKVPKWEDVFKARYGKSK